MKKTFTITKFLPFLWLIAGFLLVLIFHGPYTTLIGSWLAPIFLILYYRTRNTWPGVLAAAAVFIIAGTISFWNTIGLPLLSRLALMAGYNFIFCLPFFADFLLARRIKSFAATLVLPLAAVIVEYLLVSFSPWGTSGSVANTQFQNLPFHPDRLGHRTLWDHFSYVLVLCSDGNFYTRGLLCCKALSYHKGPTQ